MNIVVLLGVVITFATGIPVLLQILRNHPRGLIICFFAEMWERFSYYGMRGLLIFYLTQHFLFSDSAAGSIYGSYTSLVYLLPLIGGLLADRWLGTRKAVAFGALLLVAGHGMMAVEGTPAKQTLVYAGQSYDVDIKGRMEERQVRVMIAGQPHEFAATAEGGLEVKNMTPGGPLPAVMPKGSYELKNQVDPFGKNAFYLAVSLIIMGVGFLKPNISTIVGQLYPQGDPRRDSGFTLYYYGINLGAFWASVLCGWLGTDFGWWAGFGLAGVGMALGFVVFILGKPLLQGKGEGPATAKLKQKLIGPLNREWSIYLFGILGVIPVWFLVQRNEIVGAVLGLSTLASLAFIGYVMAVICKTWAQRQRMMLAVVLIFGSVLFFTLFEQAGTSLNLFAARNVDLMGIDAAQTQSFNAGFILIFAPVFAAMWAYLGARKKMPNPTLTFGLGLLQVGLGFLVVVWTQGLAVEYKMPLYMLGFLYMLHTTGELFLSPVGLSQITKLSVAKVVSFMMAVWFLASSIAQYVGGIIAGAMGTETVGGQVLDSSVAFATSMDGFNKLGWAGVTCGVVFVALSFLIKGWAHGADQPPAETPLITPTVDGEQQAARI